MLLSLMLTAWPLFVIASVGLISIILIAKAIKYRNKKNSEDHRD